MHIYIYIYIYIRVYIKTHRLSPSHYSIKGIVRCLFLFIPLTVYALGHQSRPFSRSTRSTKILLSAKWARANVVVGIYIYILFYIVYHRRRRRAEGNAKTLCRDPAEKTRPVTMFIVGRQYRLFIYLFFFIELKPGNYGH